MSGKLESSIRGTSNFANKQSNWLLASMVCLLSALFYLYEFVLQVSPGVMTNELMKAFMVDATGLGTISAFYYYAYTPMQLPAGVLYDRFGPRILLSIAVIVCALGAFFFSMTHSVIFASYGRFLMGLGSAFSFIGALLLISRWFPPHYFAFLAGMVQLMSSVGAIMGEAPLATAIAKFGWRQSLSFIGYVGIALAIVIWLLVRDQPPWKKADSVNLEHHGSMHGLKTVIKDAQTWFVGIYSFSVWAPIVIFAALWGVPYLATLYNKSTAVASSAVSMVWIGIGIGSPIVGWLSDVIGRRCIPLIICGICGIISSLCILYVPNVPFPVMYVLLFLLGIGGSGQSLSFGVVKDINHPKSVGTAIGFNNMATVAGGALFQPFVGLLLNYFWDHTVRDGVHVYSAAAYQKSMFIIPLCYIVATLLSMYWIRETHCKSIYEH